jgi:polyferredoxin
MAKKIKKIQLFRHLIQLVLFFLLPGLYIIAFSEFKGIYQMIIKGNFNFIKAFPSLFQFSTVILMTIIFGRFFCGWLCAFGAFNDLIYALSKKVFKNNYRVNNKVDSILKYLKYIILLFIMVIAWTMGSTLFSTVSPWDAFAQITNFPQIISDFTIGFILLILITIGAFFIERFFCRYLCPLGALFTIFSKISIFKINMPKAKCGNCRACTSHCSMGIPLNKIDEMKGKECINCLKCVEICPRKNAVTNLLHENINPILASSIVIAAFVGVYALNHFGALVLADKGISSVKTNISLNTNISSPSHKYKDGTYFGTGTGFNGGTTKILITIKNGNISNIKTISNQDTPDFYQRAESAIPDEVLSAQSSSVDTVTGATFSSKGIISAVTDALRKAI